MSAPKLPKGWRWLRVGDRIEKGDKFWAGSKWDTPEITVGMGWIATFHKPMIRRVAVRDPKPAPKTKATRMAEEARAACNDHTPEQRRAGVNRAMEIIDGAKPAPKKRRASTFARAACIALIKAKRAEKGAA